MKIEEALVIWAYRQHQYKPTLEAQRASDRAWKVICEEANRIIYAAPAESNGDLR